MHLRSDRPGRLVYKIYVFFIVLLANVSHAQLAQNLTIGSAKAVSLANAVTADPTGIDSIHFNPAGLHQVKDRQYQLKLIGGHFSISGDIQRSDRYKREMEINGYNYDDDPVEEGESSTQDVSVMLPVVGMTDIPVLLAPLGGASVELVDDGVVFGTSVFAPMIVGYDRGEDSPLRYQGVKLGLTHLTYFSPTVAFKVTETFTMGLGVHLNYTGVAIDLDFRLPNAVLFAVDDLSTLVCGTPLFDDLINLCEGDLGPFTDIGAIEIEVEDNFNPSFNVGFLWEPTAWFSWGMVYQSGAETTLEGEYLIEYGDDWVGFFDGFNSTALGSGLSVAASLPKGVEKESGEVSLEFTIPRHFATGISVKVLPDWKINLDAKWTDTAAWDQFKIEFKDGADFLPVLSLIDPERAGPKSLTFPRGYESVWTWAIGVEHQYSDAIKLRAGYEDRGSSIPENKADFLAPFGKAKFYGAGFSYILSDAQLFEFGIGMLASKTDIKDNQSSNVNSRNQLIYNPYAGTNIKTEVQAFLIEMSYHKKF